LEIPAEFAFDLVVVFAEFIDEVVRICHDFQCSRSRSHRRYGHR
jgi:hypothetical protein